MKTVFFLFFTLCSLGAQSQHRYQIGVGGGFNFLQSVDMTSGNIGLKFKRDKNLLGDYNKVINKKNNISLGVQTLFNVASYWYELNKSISYYSAKSHIPIFQFESAELNLYIKKAFKLAEGTNTGTRFFIQLGPCFNINKGNARQTRHGLRDDNGQTFQISQILYKAQKPYVPYLRIGAGFEMMKKFKKNYFLGLSPFISWAGLQSESNELTVLKDDPTYISTGDFKRNRSGYGIRLIFSK